MNTMIKSLFAKKVVITRTINTRNLDELARYSRDGFALEFKGTEVIATKTVRI